MTLEEHERHPGLLNWMVRWLEAIDKESEIMNRELSCLYYIALLLQLFEFVGHKPNLGECGRCRQLIQPKDLAWSHDLGGFTHLSCLSGVNGFPLNVSVGKLLRYLDQVKPLELSRLSIDLPTIHEACELLDDFYRYHFGRQLKLSHQICHL
jgi:recombinational DNA repair protein (RecF pathway)